MAGRNPKPFGLHVINGNPSHLTKAELKTKKNSEVRFGDSNFKMPSAVKKRPEARKKWGEIIKLFTDYDVDFVSTSDTTILERYCLTYADYMYLQDVREEIETRGREKGSDKVGMFLTMDKFNLDSNINKKADLLTKLEDRLFLNPLAKVRNIPKKKQDTGYVDPHKQMFGD